MKILITDTTNNRIQIEINENDFIRDIKKKIIEKEIQDKIGSIILHYEGQILEEDEKVSSYDIEEYSQIIAVKKFIHRPNIIVVDSRGYKEQFKECLTIVKIKEKLRIKYGIKTEINLLYEGTILEDHDRPCDFGRDDEIIILSYEGKFRN